MFNVIEFPGTDNNVTDADISDFHLKLRHNYVQVVAVSSNCCDIMSFMRNRLKIICDSYGQTTGHH